jgi:hypothetical protein
MRRDNAIYRQLKSELVLYGISLSDIGRQCHLDEYYASWDSIRNIVGHVLETYWKQPKIPQFERYRKILAVTAELLAKHRSGKTA